jgi:hypothetical protein
MEVNRPDVVAELAALTAGYNDALLNNKVDELVNYFWDSEHALRFGVTEELYGADEISAFRKARVVNFPDRKTARDTTTTFGDSLAVSNIEFTVTINGNPRHGRQSQVWVRFPDLGWRIVAAHVSHRVTAGNAAAFGQGKAAAYAAAAAALLDMPVAPEHAPGVARDLDVMSRVVSPLMALDLSDIEPAPTFRA